MIILVSGKMRSGKDTLADYLVKHAGFSRTAFADYLKVCALRIIKSGEDFDNTHRKEAIEFFDNTSIRKQYRPFLIGLGQLLRNTVDINFWCSHVLTACYGDTVISDCRFPNEIDYFKNNTFMQHNNQNIIACRVNATDEVRIARGAQIELADDISEIALDNYNFDYILDNNTTPADFYKKIEIFLQDVNKNRSL